MSRVPCVLQGGMWNTERIQQYGQVVTDEGRKSPIFTGLCEGSGSSLTSAIIEICGCLDHLLLWYILSIMLQ